MKQKVFILGVLVITSAVVAQSRPVQLISDVVVQRESISLSDLLPDTADSQLRSATSTISLGRSPQLGSFRVFTREQLRHKIGDQFDVMLPEQVVVRKLAEESTSQSHPHASLRTHDATQFLVQPRVPAWLIFDDDGIRIQMRVLPLRGATLGETVRVLDPGNHRVLVAEVSGEGLLRFPSNVETPLKGH